MYFSESNKHPTDKFYGNDFDIEIDKEMSSKTSLIIDKLNEIKNNRNIDNEEKTDIDWY